MIRSRTFWLALVLLLIPVTSAHARVLRLVITRVESPFFDARTFGAVGQYEMLIGYAEGELDPRDPRNALIVNIDKAPRNARGMVEYRIDVRILKPRNMSASNGRIFYHVSNRGGLGGLDQLRDGDPTLTNLMVERGYTVVWSGWQGDLRPEQFRAHLPVAKNADGSSIVKLHREEWIFNNTTNPIITEGPMARTNGVGSLSYPAADMDPSKATLRVRQYALDPWHTPADMTWSYVSPTVIRINRPKGFDAGAIYEFIYPAKDPIVMGMGSAAMRDFVSFLRYDAKDGAGTANPLAGRIQKTMGHGVSLSGRYLRDFVYQGFNEDEQGRPVFDGLFPQVGGSRKSEVNREFSISGDVSFQHEDNLSQMHQFPFAYQVLTDPVSGRTDGILARCLKSQTCPKIVQMDSDTEVIHGAASLLVTDPTGAPIDLPDNVRWYVMAGNQHGGGGDDFVLDPWKPELNTASGRCQLPRNALSYTVQLRALVVALDEWITNGTAPPDDQHPSVANGTLVPPTHPRAGFPAIPGFKYFGLVNVPRLRDYSTYPVKEGPAYPVFVIAKDADGNNKAGIRHPFLEVPVGTHTAINYRVAGNAENALCENSGAWVPFASTKAERIATRDQRPSVEERYPQHNDYVAKVKEAVDRHVKARLLLPEDGQRLVRYAEQSIIGTSVKPRTAT